jgi:DNA-binding transcriptional MocR family regulator
MKIPLDRQSAKPVYLQISDRLSRLIKSGALPPGEKLPSIRCLAETTHVNKLTVIEAYGILEADGLVEARQGSGYFVNKIQTCTTKPCTFAPAQQVIIPEGSNPTFFETYYASIDAHNQPDTINFHFGVPAPADLGDLQKIARRSLSNIGDNVFNYDIPEGQLTLRKQIVQILIQRGLEVSPEQLMITNGSKQGMSLVVNHYVQPGDWVIVESPTYVGILAMLENLGARVIGIPMTGAGMNLELLSQYLHSHRPRLIYTISTLHNPTGITTNEAHRRELLNLAQQYSCPILEDNAYEGLNFEPVPPPIKALDQSNLVTYIGTFSKTLMPGLRVGYMVAPKDTHQALLERKFFSDFHTSTVTQGIVSEYLASGHYRRHLSHLKSVHLDNRNIMLKALETYFPTTCSWTVPKGGVFLWVTLPEGVPLQEICQQAAKKRVIVGNGALFFPGKQSYPAMRLSFSAPPEDIEYGIMTLGEIVKSYL